MALLPRRKYERPSRFDKWERTLQLLAVVAISPAIILAGSLIQAGNEESKTDKEYVVFAVELLRDEKTTKEMKDWAIEILNSRSPVPFTKEVKQELSQDVVRPALRAFTSEPSLKLAHMLTLQVRLSELDSARKNHDWSGVSDHLDAIRAVLGSCDLTAFVRFPLFLGQLLHTIDLITSESNAPEEVKKKAFEVRDALKQFLR